MLSPEHGLAGSSEAATIKGSLAFVGSSPVTPGVTLEKCGHGKQAETKALSATARDLIEAPNARAQPRRVSEANEGTRARRARASDWSALLDLNTSGARANDKESAHSVRSSLDEARGVILQAHHQGARGWFWLGDRWLRLPRGWGRSATCDENENGGDCKGLHLAPPAAKSLSCPC